jgi:hypothetical membrane protein
MGAAVMGVGIFPGDTGAIHGLATLVAFVTSSLSEMLIGLRKGRLTTSPQSLACFR